MERIAALWPLWLALLLINLFTFIVYAVDKQIARRHKGERRVPERTLVALSFCGGCIGALLGMFLCRHKTKHAKFLILVPLSALIWAAGVAVLVLYAIKLI